MSPSQQSPASQSETISTQDLRNMLQDRKATALTLAYHTAVPLSHLIQTWKMVAGVKEYYDIQQSPEFTSLQTVEALFNQANDLHKRLKQAGEKSIKENKTHIALPMQEADRFVLGIDDLTQQEITWHVREALDAVPELALTRHGMQKQQLVKQVIHSLDGIAAFNAEYAAKLSALPFEQGKKAER